jgi:thioredoxin 1
MPVEATDATFADEVLDAEEPVIVDFWAPWCRPCKAVEPVLRAIGAERGLRVVRVDVDENPVTASRYGVLSLPTVVLFRDGEPRATVYGAQPRRRFEDAFAPFI